MYSADQQSRSPDSDSPEKETSLGSEDVTTGSGDLDACEVEPAGCPPTATDQVQAMSDSSVFAASAIPIDLFISKKHPGVSRGNLGFADSCGNIVYNVMKLKSESLADNFRKRRVMLDAAGNPIISLNQDHKGSWKAFKEGIGGETEVIIIFDAERTRNTLTRTEWEVHVHLSTSLSFKMRGFPFQRSCTICHGDNIVAQTSLMYKLRQIYVKRSKFRLTIYPGSIDHALIVAMVVVFFDGKMTYHF